MQRHFYVSDDLDDGEPSQQELESESLHRPRIHVFSRDHSAVESRDQLHDIESVFDKDLVQGSIVGTGRAAPRCCVMGQHRSRTVAAEILP
jgi:hypothetical protein